MDNVKFVLIGGGSYGWTHTLVTDIACTPALRGTHIILQDINPEPLKTVVPLCQKISEQLNADLKIEGMTDLDSALPGADFVGLTISTGGAWADDLDIRIPARYGVLQLVGDTVGPGGWSRALRNIPVVTDIVRKVERLAPAAWFMNYSNPMTVLTSALNRVSPVRSMGICHELQGFLLHAAYFLGVDWKKDITLSIAGINHLIWILDMTVRGQDGLALLKNYAQAPENFKPLGPRVISEELARSGGLAPGQDVKFDLFERCGYLPAAGDAHISEFFPHYLRTEETAQKWGFMQKGRKTHLFARTDGRDDRENRVRSMLEGAESLWLKHSHEHADGIIAALSGKGEALVTPLNCPNVGQVDNLPRNAVLETLAYLDAGGMRPLAAGSLPAPVVQYLMRHIPNQEMLTEAGLTGNREMAVCALANDPLIPDPCTAEKIAGDFFEAFRDYLPQFNGRWRL